MCCSRPTSPWGAELRPCLPFVGLTAQVHRAQRTILKLNIGVPSEPVGGGGRGGEGGGACGGEVAEGDRVGLWPNSFSSVGTLN